MDDERLWDPTSGERVQIGAGVSRLRTIDGEIARLQAERTAVIDGLTRVALAQQERCRRVPIGVRRGGEAVLSRDDLPMRSMIAQIAAATRTGRRSVAAQTSAAWQLHERFPAVREAFSRGEVDEERVGAILAPAGRLESDEDRALYERVVLPHAVEGTVPATRQAARRVVAEIAQTSRDERCRRARETRAVHVHDLDDGMAELTLVAEALVVHGIHDRVTRMARSLRRAADAEARERDAAGEGAGAAGEASGGGQDAASERDARSFDQLRADLATDLLLTGEVSAHRVADASGRNLLDTLTARVQVSIPAAALTGRSVEPAHLAGHGAVDAGSVCRVAATSPTWARLFHDPETGALRTVDRYTPTAAQRRLLLARDESCRFPACTRRGEGCDIDHTVDHARGGETHVGNLAHLCRFHHVLKHHTAWQVRRLGRGELAWIDPSGGAHRTRPAPAVRFVDSRIIAGEKNRRERGVDPEAGHVGSPPPTERISPPEPSTSHSPPVPPVPPVPPERPAVRFADLDWSDAPERQLVGVPF
ncbi:MAG: DUF222 domain-containing protein [Microbacterium sp.]